MTDNAAVLQQRVTKASNIFLSTLTAPGESQFLTALKPCGILMPHMHQRANEFYSMIFGAQSIPTHAIPPRSVTAPLRSATQLISCCACYDVLCMLCRAVHAVNALASGRVIGACERRCCCVAAATRVGLHRVRQMRAATLAPVMCQRSLWCRNTERGHLAGERRRAGHHV